MKPSFIPKTSFSQERRFFSNIKLNDEWCPEGTVPIKRMSKSEFIKSRQFTKDYASRIISNDIKGVPGDHFAILETNTGPSTLYKGVGGIFSVHGGLPIKPSQYSSAGLIMRNGNDLVQYGWTINPSLNHDNRTRFFQYFSAGTTHCFNIQCPGFVNLPGLPIDLVFEKVTRSWFYARVIDLIIYKDPKDGNWWLGFGPPAKRQFFGFWPHQIFSSLTDSASYIAVGGEAYGPLSDRLPAMGNGYYPSINDVGFSAFCCNFIVLDEDYLVIKDPQNTRAFSDDSHYGVHDVGTKSILYKKYGRMVYYGGTTKRWENPT